MYETPKNVFFISCCFSPMTRALIGGKKYTEMKIGKNKVFFSNCSKLFSIALDNDFDPSYQISEELSEAAEAL